MKKDITVFGLGFVGLTTALAFAEKGNNVYGYDVNKEKTEVIKSGKLPFVEPGLDTALIKHINNNFRVIEDVNEAVKNSEYIFICVGTPCGDDGNAELKYIYSVIDIISNQLKDGKQRVLVVKSTIPPSTTSENIIPYLLSKELDVPGDVSVANNPEFLREGHCWDDMINADRIVCGVSDDIGRAMLEDLYKKFDIPFFAVSLNTGEFIKYLSNTFLATMISYANEMSKIADVIGNIQIKEAFEILHLDKRWKNGNMSSYVYPGCGYGGYCLPKDTKAMYSKSVSKGFNPEILKSVTEINETMPTFMVDKIRRVSNTNNKIGILGLSFKPESDDVRDSSSAKIIRELFKYGYEHINAYDPISVENFEVLYRFNNIKYYTNVDEICKESDVLVLATAWDEFKNINKRYPDKRIVDCRYFLRGE